MVEIKGDRGLDAQEKASTMKTYWVPGVNHLGTHGRWPLAEFCDNDEIESNFKAKVESQFSKMITAVAARKPGDRVVSFLSLSLGYYLAMTITLPDLPALNDMGEEGILLDLACGAYAAGHLSRQLAADLAGISRYDFDTALYTRRIPSFTEEMLAQDLETLRIFGSR
jgi:predicted HTH domain antitoxin